MTDPQYPKSNALDKHATNKLVGDYLDHVSQQVDVAKFAGRVTCQLGLVDSRPKLPNRIWFPRRLVISAVTVMSIVLAFLGGRSLGPWQIQAATVLRDAYSVHSRPVDRCYRVLFSPDPDYWDGRNILRAPSETVLWTRGDRFWADSKVGDIEIVYGRDEKGKAWVSPNRTTGIRFGKEGEKLPDHIEMYCAVNSMTFPTLVENVLADFDLRIDSGPQGSENFSATQARGSVVWASLKEGHTHPLISTALFEVDHSGTLAKLVLWTVDGGQRRGTITFTLIDTDHLGDEQYKLSAHLDGNAKVRTHEFNAEYPLEDSGSR